MDFEVDELTSVTTRILVVDDHYIMRRGLCELLNHQPGFHVGAAVGDARQALEAARHEPYDLAILDVSLGDMNGIELAAKLKAEHPDLTILMLSMHDESLYAERAAAAGASGFVAKQRAAEDLLSAIEHVLRGGYRFSHL